MPAVLEQKQDTASESQRMMTPAILVSPAAPAWLSRTARPTFGARPPMSDLRSRFASPSDLLDFVSAMTVQEDYAARCRAEVQRFVTFMTEDPQAQDCIRSAQQTVSVARILSRPGVITRSLLQQKLSDSELVGKLLAIYGCAQLMSLRKIGRSSTVRQILIHASRPWPKAMSSAPVKAFLEGLEWIDPALPVHAGVTIERDLDLERLWVLIRELSEAREAEPLWVTAGAMAGLRVREAIRFMTVPEATMTDDEGFITWRDRALVKTNLKGRKLLADRYSWMPPEAMTVMTSRPAPWVLTEAQAKALAAAVATLWKEAGVVMDARSWRRAMAVRVRQAMVEGEGVSEERALEFVRWALGHREGSLSTFRYLGTRLSQATAATLRQAQAPPPPPRRG